MNVLIVAGIALLAFFALIFLWVWWGDRRAKREFARRYKAAEIEGTYWHGPGKILYMPHPKIWGSSLFGFEQIVVPPDWYPKYVYPNGMDGRALPNTPYSPTDSIDSPQEKIQ